MPLLNPFAEQATTPRYYNKLIIPAAQFKSLNSAPIIFIPPAGNKCLILRHTWIKKAAGTAYAANGNASLSFNFISASGARVLAWSITFAGFFDQAAEGRYFQEYQANSFAATTLAANTQFGNSWEVRWPTADLVTGDGDIELNFIWNAFPVIPTWF